MKYYVGISRFLSRFYLSGLGLCPVPWNTLTSNAKGTFLDSTYVCIRNLKMNDFPTFFYFQCAMEENCLASEAYRIRKEDPNFAMATRRLMRYNIRLFSSKFRIKYDNFYTEIYQFFSLKL
jgi:hypothetical protein